jgi:hypothetical protein
MKRSKIGNIIGYFREGDADEVAVVIQLCQKAVAERQGKRVMTAPVIAEGKPKLSALARSNRAKKAWRTRKAKQQVNGAVPLNPGEMEYRDGPEQLR